MRGERTMGTANEGKTGQEHEVGEDEKLDRDE
jgi:hypothetical protein